jgi:ribosome biogenesis GTPase
VQQTFQDIDVLAQDCGYSDCTHAGEPRCAVAAAVAEGRLAADRLEAWLRLRAEPQPAGYEASRGLVEDRKRRKAARRAGRRSERP